MGNILEFKDIRQSRCDVRSIEDLNNIIEVMESSKLEKNFSLRVTLSSYDDNAIAIIKQIVEKAK